MSDQHYQSEEEKTHDNKSFMEKISDKIHGHDSPTSPIHAHHDSSEDLKSTTNINTSSLKDKVTRLFGREKPLHRVLGGGQPADLFLWRNKKLSGGILGGITAMWVLFDVLEYHLLTLICHGLMLGLAILFVWSNATTFISKSPPRIPDMCIPEEPLLKLVSALRSDVNRGLATLREIASGRELKKFIAVIAGLWVLSVLGSCCGFLTLLYTLTVALFTVPIFYEKYEDKIDSLAEKAMAELKKQYAVFDAKILSKIPRGPLKNKKFD